MMFAKIYPHYPHKKVKIRWIIWGKKRTDVLWSYNKNRFLNKNIRENIDF